jgi:hypothetical protein
MAIFDRRFVQPSEEELAKTLREAVAVTNRGCRTAPIVMDAATVESVLEAQRSQAEGTRFWLGEAKTPTQKSRARLPLVGLAWWTDWNGQRHLRIFGDRIGRFDLRARQLPGEIPPLTLVYPDATCLVSHPPGTRELVSLCRCGTVGSPEAVRWMGPCCGPCYDRALEGRPPLEDFPPFTYSRADGVVTHLQFAASGRSFVSARTDGEQTWVDFWGWPSAGCRGGTVVPRCFSHGLVPFAANDRHIVVDRPEGCLVWQQDAPSTCSSFQTGFQFRSLALSSKGRFLAGIADQSLLLFDEDWSSSRPRQVEREMFIEAHPLAFTPDQATVAVGTSPFCVYLVDAAEGKVTGVLNDAPTSFGSSQTAHVRCLAFSPEGRWLAAGCGSSLDSPEEQAPVPGGNVLVWERDHPAPAVRLPAHTGSVNAVTFTPDGALLVTGGTDGVVRCYDTATWEEVLGLEWHRGPVMALAFSPNGRWLLSGAGDGTIRVWPWHELLNEGAPRRGCLEMEFGEAQRAVR